MTDTREVAPSGRAREDEDEYYGITLPERVSVVLTAILRPVPPPEPDAEPGVEPGVEPAVEPAAEPAAEPAQRWVPAVVDLIGDYSIQSNLRPGQIDVTGADVATEGNHAMILDSLRARGFPMDDHSYFSRAAVRAHEEAHATHLRTSLLTVAREIKKRVARLSVPAGGPGDATTPEQAVTRIEALTDFQEEFDPTDEDGAYDLWYQAFYRACTHDHDAGGITEVAELGVLTPLIAAIEQRRTAEGWPVSVIPPAPPLEAPEPDPPH